MSMKEQIKCFSNKTLFESKIIFNHICLCSPERNFLVEDPRRTQSDLDIHERNQIRTTNRKSNPHLTTKDGGEFYTAIGTDGININSDNSLVEHIMILYPIEVKYILCFSSKFSGKEMILQRYHGPIGDLMSSKQSTSSVPISTQLEDDRGFLSMAINHLQNNGNSGSNTGNHNNLLSNEVRNAELNQFGPDFIRNDNMINSDASVTKRR